jgi:glutamyl-tRNA synthetase
MSNERTDISGPVRVRFAPSPTGFLHVGGVRTAMFSWLAARHYGGQFILRIEDTDQKRYVEGAEDDLKASLRWVGVEWDEGPDVGGPHAPYRQSERLPLYQQHAHQLVAVGCAYKSWSTPEQLDAERKQAAANHQPPPLRDRWRNATPEQIAEAEASGQPYTIRLKMPEQGSTSFYDFIKNETIIFENDKIDDTVLLKSDGYPTYHLAVVVDDNAMGITHVMRAEEWIASTPKHIRLYECFGWELPVFAHVPNILRSDGRGKLSKRDGDVTTNQYWEKGYLPEAMFNFLALQGWSYDGETEIMSQQEIVERFSLTRIQPSPARWDINKLNWMNGYYINHILSVDDLARRALPFMHQAGLLTEVEPLPGDDQYLYFQAIIALLKDRIKLLSEVPDLTGYFFADHLEYDPALLLGKDKNAINVEQGREIIEYATTMLQADKYAAWHLTDKEEGPEAEMRVLAEQMGLKPGPVFMPLRVAITGRTQSPPLFETMEVLGRERVMVRLRDATNMLESMQ